MKTTKICKKHGSFYQTPNNHLKGQDCPRYDDNIKNKISECLL